MLMKTLMETYRDVTRQFMPGPPVTTVTEHWQAANESRWANDNTQARRLRRQRRMDRAARQPVNGWSVRTW